MKLAFVLFLCALTLNPFRYSTVYHPVFSRCAFQQGDSLLFADLFDAQKNRIFPDDINDVSTADSCVVYMVYDVKGSYHPYTVLKEHYRKRILETYKRRSNKCWMRYKDGKSELLIEKRKNILLIDTATLEDPNNPGSFHIRITKHYEMRPCR